MPSPRALVSAVGAWGVSVVELVGALGLLAGDVALNSRRLFARGRARRMAWAQVWAQAVRVGVKAIPIVALVVFCIGTILSLQIVPILRDYGAQDQIADIIAIAMFRELGPLVGAITLTGFAGASIAAELGTMAVSEELEALQSHAIEPVRFLVVPRVLATCVMTACLAVLADLMGVAGGLVASTFGGEGGDPWAYLDRSLAAVRLRDFYTGLFKAAVFGAIIALLACHLGMNVKGGAEGVGAATTRTVVLTIVFLTVVDLAFTAAFFTLDI